MLFRKNKIKYFQKRKGSIESVFQKMSSKLEKLKSEIFEEMNAKNQKIADLTAELKELGAEMNEVNIQKEKIDKLL